MVQRSLVIRFMICAMVLALPITVFGNAVGKPGGGGSSVQWDVNAGPHDRIELRVIDPNGEVAASKSFKAGQTPTLRLKDLGEVVDGQYTYELVVIPSIPAGLAKQLEAARAAGDEAAARKLMRQHGLGTVVTQTGGLTVQFGAFVSPDATESDAGVSNVTTTSPQRGAGPSSEARPGEVTANAEVIPQDLIVQGSACVGIDCVSTESFGFDTIRMKENNTRIDFTDTSTSAGFPSEDWEIAANDSASGGRNALIISDSNTQLMVIEAGTSANAVYVDDTGRVGFKTSTPVLDLHVSDTDTPAIRLEQTNAGGFTAQTWDVAGNEANFFVRDVTGGSLLPFRIRPGAPTSSIDVNSAGIVGIGTGSPALVNGITRGVHISAEFPALRFTATGTGGHDYQFQLGSSGQLGISDVTGGTNNNRIFIAGTGNIGIGTTTTTSLLTVAGDVRTIGGAFIDDGTTLNAPDYVFDESYRLMPLEDVAKFIEENNHLPNVPSAKDIKANGLNLSQMQMKLLEKVEELTLYTVAQQATIKKLEARLAELEVQTQK